MSDPVAALVESVLHLQAEFDSSLTPAMKQRGDSVRALRDALRDELARREHTARLSVDASDGVGRKAFVPWVRVYDKEASPRPTAGYYVVLLFAADGSAMYVSLNQGTSSWVGGDIVREPVHVIRDRAKSARESLELRDVYPEGAIYEIALASSGRGRGLAEGYEAGNIAAFSIERGDSVSMGELVAQIESLELARRRVDPSNASFSLGADYRLANELAAEVDTPAVWLEHDLAKLTKRTADHMRLQNRLAQVVRDAGHTPLSPLGAPEFDLAWKTQSTVWIVEVKTIMPSNESSQMRLGLGQLLEYCSLVRGRYAGVEVRGNSRDEPATSQSPLGISLSRCWGPPRLWAEAQRLARAAIFSCLSGMSSAVVCDSRRSRATGARTSSNWR